MRVRNLQYYVAYDNLQVPFRWRFNWIKIVLQIPQVHYNSENLVNMYHYI